MNQIINMIMRIVMHKGMNMGTNKGIDHIYSNKDTAPNSPEAKQTQKNAGAASKNANQTMLMARHLGRF